MAIDKDDIEKIIAGVVGGSIVGAVGLGISALVDSVVDNGGTFEPSDSGNRNISFPDLEEDDEYYSDVPTVNEIFEEDRIQREMYEMADVYHHEVQ